MSSRIIYILSESVQTLFFRKYRESVFLKKTESNRVCTYYVQRCKDPERVFSKFRTESIPALYCAFFEAVTARLQTARVKKVSIQGLRQCTLPVHCRYIACFARYWACFSRYGVVWSRIPIGFRVFTWSFGGPDNALLPYSHEKWIISGIFIPKNYRFFRY